MILTDYYQGTLAYGKKTRYNIVESTQSYDVFEQLLVNKRPPDQGGQSFYLVDRPARWGNRWERSSDKAITKGVHNISSIIVPDPTLMMGYGDVKGTNDALLVRFHLSYDIMYVYIARGQKNNKLNLYQLMVDDELWDEISYLHNKAVINDLFNEEESQNDEMEVADEN